MERLGASLKKKLPKIKTPKVLANLGKKKSDMGSSQSATVVYLRSTTKKGDQTKKKQKRPAPASPGSVPAPPPLKGKLRPKPAPPATFADALVQAAERKEEANQWKAKHFSAISTALPDKVKEHGERAAEAKRLKAKAHQLLQEGLPKACKARETRLREATTRKSQANQILVATLPRAVQEHETRVATNQPKQKQIAAPVPSSPPPPPPVKTLAPSPIKPRMTNMSLGDEVTHLAKKQEEKLRSTVDGAVDEVIGDVSQFVQRGEKRLQSTLNNTVTSTSAKALSFADDATKAFSFVADDAAKALSFADDAADFVTKEEQKLQSRLTKVVKAIPDPEKVFAPVTSLDSGHFAGELSQFVQKREERLLSSVADAIEEGEEKALDLVSSGIKQIQEDWIPEQDLDVDDNLGNELFETLTSGGANFYNHQQKNAKKGWFAKKTGAKKSGTTGKKEMSGSLRKFKKSLAVALKETNTSSSSSSGVSLEEWELVRPDVYDDAPTGSLRVKQIETRPAYAYHSNIGKMLLLPDYDRVLVTENGLQIRESTLNRVQTQF